MRDSASFFLLSLRRCPAHTAGHPEKLLIDAGGGGKDTHRIRTQDAMLGFARLAVAEEPMMAVVEKKGPRDENKNNKKSQ